MISATSVYGSSPSETKMLLKDMGELLRSEGYKKVPLSKMYYNIKDDDFVRYQMKLRPNGKFDLRVFVDTNPSKGSDTQLRDKIESVLRTFAEG